MRKYPLYRLLIICFLAVLLNVAPANSANAVEGIAEIEEGSEPAEEESSGKSEEETGEITMDDETESPEDGNDDNSGESDDNPGDEEGGDNPGEGGDNPGGDEGGDNPAEGGDNPGGDEGGDNPGEGGDNPGGDDGDDNTGEGGDNPGGDEGGDNPGEGGDNPGGDEGGDNPGEGGDNPGDEEGNQNVKMALLIAEGNYEPIKLIVDSGLRLHVEDGNLIATESDGESICFELRNITSMRYLAFIEQTPDISVSVEEIRLAPELTITSSEITITNPSDITQQFFIHRIDGVSLGTFNVADSITISLQAYPPGIYVLTGRNISPVKFIIR